MKVVLFCGGYGTRLREYSETIPKPLVPVGERPILWQLMKYYAHFGHKEFLLCLGYRGQMIKEFFLNYDDCLSNDFTLAQGGQRIELHGEDIREWTVTFLNTGMRSNIGQRLLRVRDWLEGEEIFLANYSDGLSDLPLDEHVEHFRRSGAVASFLAVRPSNSLSGVDVDADGYVRGIDYLSRSVLINGGFFVFRSEIFDYINEGEELVEAPFHRLIKARKLLAYPYSGFWSAMDTFKDKKCFDDLHESGERPWEVWNSEHTARPAAHFTPLVGETSR
jgi:glucose-1-phosphate cytidylyltransferase